MKSPLVKTLNDCNIDPNFYVPIELENQILNEFISNKGGVMPSTITMVYGDAGAGKTTILCDWLCEAEKTGANCLFVSSEMDHLDFGEYGQRFGHFRDLNTYYPTAERSIREDIEELFGMGWDLILIDSFKDLSDKVRFQEGATTNEVEHWLVELMKDTKQGVINDEGKKIYTSFFVIQQVLKSGNFAGSNNLKHQISASLRLTVEGDTSYMMFNKNRRGRTQRRMYYTIGETSVEYDVERVKYEDMGEDFKAQEEERREDFKNQFATLESLFDEAGDQTPEKEKNQRYTDPSDLDKDLVAQLITEHDGNVSAVRRQLLADGVIDVSVSRYRLVSWIDSVGGLGRQRF